MEGMRAQEVNEKGISTADFPEALCSILGENAQGLSPKSIERLKMKWVDEYK